MRSKIAQKILDETPKEVEDKVRLYANRVTMIKAMTGNLKADDNFYLEKVSGKYFNRAKIGLYDENGEHLKNGDKIKIEVTKDVWHEGDIVYRKGAFCIRYYQEPLNPKIVPLCNYSPNSKIFKQAL